MARILMVEDSKFMRDRIGKALRAAGHEVLEAADGAIGLEMVATSPLDCVLLDLNMPVVGGVEFLTRLRGGGSHLPVVVLTADIQTSTQDLCVSLGISGFVAKPSCGADLCRAIDDVMTGARGEIECV